MDWNWRLRAACLNVDPNASAHGDSTSAQLKQFVKKYCNRCTVVEQCWDNRIVETDKGIFDDSQWTVRGGRLPGNSTGRNRGRPSGGGPSLADLMYENEPDRYLNTLIGWMDRHPDGKCKHGHEIKDPFTDLKVTGRTDRPAFAQCLICQRESSKTSKQESRAQEEPKVKTHCRNGHLITKENSSIRRLNKDGKYREYRRCTDCKSASDRRAEAKRGKIAA
jgi:transcription factor WhiB